MRTSWQERLLCWLYMAGVAVVADVEVVTRSATDRNRRPLPPEQMRQVFMDAMSDQVNETQRVKGFLLLIHAQLGRKKRLQTSEGEMKKAEMVQWLRQRDVGVVSLGLEGPDVINQPVSEFMYQSDMVLNKGQAKVLADVALQDLSEEPARSKRQAQTGPAFPKNQWTVGEAISYFFDNSIQPHTRHLIRMSVLFWQDHTCLSFEENGAQRPRVRFFQGGGCYSQVGKAFGQAEQVISIGKGCEQFGIITHEIAHTLGFFHSHARHDRDSYVEVMYSNLSPQMTTQFTKQSPHTNNNFGVIYDYGSVMHYADSKSSINNIAFAADSAKSVVTMLARDKIYQHTMGNNVGPSFSDLLEMNIYYNCVKTCADGIFCKNGGFRRPNNCTQCICPSGFGGLDCSELPPGTDGAKPDCGQVIQATKEWQHLANRVSAKGTGLTDRHATCTWHIKAEPGQRVQIKVLDVFGACSVGCFHSGLEIKVQRFTLTGARVCCQSDADNLGYLETENNLAIVIAYSAFKTRGFKLKFRAVGQPNADARPALCEDKRENCHSLLNLCSHARYYKLMTDQCPYSCMRCQQISESPSGTVIRNADPDPDRMEAPRKSCNEGADCDSWLTNGFCKSSFYSDVVKRKHCGKTCGLCDPDADE